MNARSVDYLVVGAHALAFHGAPRFTGELDVLVHPDPDNGKRFVGRIQFIADKRAIGWKKDLADIEALSEE